MYVPDAFRPADERDICEVVDRYPFAIVASADHAGCGLAVTHLPMLLDRERGSHGTLVGHLARANPHSQLLASGAPTTIVFHGPQAYVSPTWYQHEPSLPTWNYVAVHATGRPMLREDDAHLLALLSRTVEVCEAAYGESAPWTLDTDSTYVTGYTKFIVAFEMPIASLTASFKLSQNIATPLRARVIDGLRRRNHDWDGALADAMDDCQGVSGDV